MLKFFGRSTERLTFASLLSFSYKEMDMMDRAFLAMVLSRKDCCITIFKIVFDIKTIYIE